MTLFAILIVTLCFVGLRLQTATMTFSNASVFLGTWVLLLCLYQLDLAGFDPLSFEMQLYIGVFFSIYGLVYYMTYRSRAPGRTSRVEQTSSQASFQASNRVFMYVFFVLWALLFLVFVRSLGLGGVFLLITGGGARRALSEAENVNIWFYLFGYLFLVAAVYARLPRGLIKRVAFLAICGVVLSSMLVTAAKINFVSAVFLIYFVWYNKVPRPARELAVHAAVSVVGLYAFIFLFSIYTGKVVDTSVGSAASLTDVLQYGRDAFMYPYEYFVSSLAALNQVFFYTDQHQFAPGSVSFYSVYQILGRVGVLPGGIELPPQFLSFVVVGEVETNVYTLFYDILVDFGPFASILVAVGLGVLHGNLDHAEYWGTRPEILYVSQVSKLSAFLSFINFRYGDTIVILVVAIVVLSVIIRNLSPKSAVARTPQWNRARAS